MLTIIDDAAGRLSLVQPAAVIGSTDKQVIQLLSLLNQAGKQMVGIYPWQVLTVEQLFTTVATADQAAAVPADWHRFVPNSFFNRTTRRGVLGPITPQRWQALMAQPMVNLVYLSFRERTGQFLMTPTPPAGQEIAYEYISKDWVVGDPLQPDPGPKSSFTQDTDTTLLDEELLTLSLIWRFLRAKGLDYSEEMASYERELQSRCTRDGGSTILTMTPTPIDPSRINLPDGDFPI